MNVENLFIYLLVHIIVHSHFDLVGFLLVQFATRINGSVNDILNDHLSYYFDVPKRDRGKSCLSLLSNTPYKNILRCW